MPRSKKRAKDDLTTKEKRRKHLTPSRDPYWTLLQKEPRAHLGYRVTGKDSGTWFVRYRIEDGKTGSGSYKQESLGPCTDAFDYDEAQDRARRKLKDFGLGLAGDPPTFAEACKNYVEYVRHDDGRKNPGATAKDAEGRFRRLIYDNPLGRIRVDHIRYANIEKWWHELDGTKSSRNRNLAVVKAAIHRAIKVGDVTADAALPWRQIDKHKNADKKRKVYLTREQRGALIDACEGATKDLVEAAIVTGCRPGDLRDVTLGLFNARTKTVTFSAKTDEDTVPLSDAALVVFKRVAKGKLPKAHLFLRDNGLPYIWREWTKPFKAAAYKALPKSLARDTTLYVMRHCFITDALTAGMPVFEVARATRTSPEMIYKHYAHLLHDEVREKLNMVPML